MATSKKLKTIFIDIETASAAPSYDELDDVWKELWNEKVKNILPQNEDYQSWYLKRAAVMAEFARIVCICIGFFDTGSKQRFSVYSFAQTDEKKLLQDFVECMERLTGTGYRFVAGHNIREFDIPFICRRLMIQRIPIPKIIDYQDIKPWDLPLIDTFQMWRFGDYKNYTSLKLLAALFNIPSPKEEMDGSMVGTYYWEGDSYQRRRSLNKIVEYCQRDVVVTTEVYLRLTGQIGIEESGTSIYYS